MYDQSIYELDLCVLSYQLYTQTLLWPMDPYSEQMARRWTSRRDLFMAKTRDRFADRRIPVHLDPILTDLRRIRPGQPCFVKPEREGRWVAFNTPAAITDRIGASYLATEGSGQVAPLHRADDDIATRPDTLYCFEGVTGEVKHRRGYGSFLGFVLEQELEAGDDGTGEYDLHIVFRGSRSGWAWRAAFHGLFSERGNPDWTTAMDLWQQVEQPIISTQGRCSRGFSTVMAATLPTIVTCLDAIDRPHPPRAIHVSGHSLGGALATHFAAAMTIGQGAPRTEPASLGWRSWPWDNVHLRTYSAPGAGSADFRTALEDAVTVERFLIEGDPLAADGPEREGWPVHAGTKRALDLPARRSRLSLDYHEPYLVRRALVERARAARVDLSGVAAGAGGEQPDEPWKSYSSFSDLVTEHICFRDDPADAGQAVPGVSPHIVAYLEVAATVFGKRRAYPFRLRSRRRCKLAESAVRQVLEAVRRVDAHGRPSESEAVWQRVDGPLADDGFHRFLGLCLVLAHLSTAPATPLHEFGSLRQCIELAVPSADQLGRRARLRTTAARLRDAVVRNRQSLE